MTGSSETIAADSAVIDTPSYLDPYEREVNPLNIAKGYDSGTPLMCFFNWIGTDRYWDVFGACALKW